MILWPLAELHNVNAALRQRPAAKPSRPNHGRRITAAESRPPKHGRGISDSSDSFLLGVVRRLGGRTAKKQLLIVENRVGLRLAKITNRKQIVNEELIIGLREALTVSPGNVPLRIQLASALSALGRFDEAEVEYRQALSQAPDNIDIKLHLAKLYSRIGKASQAMVIMEALCSESSPPPNALVLYAKLLFADGEVRSAVSRYKQAIEADPDVADLQLGQDLGVGQDFQDSEVFEGRVRETSGDIGDEFTSEMERPTLMFDDVGGMEKVKEEIRIKILYPLLHPELYQAYGKEMGGGILMYGAPGCGKTYLARATAGEIGAGFISVGISDVLDMWTGQSERNLSSLFEHARANKPCVLFFDEVDALGGRRSDMNSGSARQLINQFLSEMDGVDKSNDGVLVLAATNAPWHVDPAFRRPGRFDRVLFVPPPDTIACGEILKLQLAGKPQDAIDYTKIAKKLEQFSGADVKAVVDAAIEEKLRQAMKTGIPQPLTTADLMNAAKTLNPTTREWFSTARNYALYSNQGGMYDEVLKYLKM
ncbi:MAG: transitional endoplasmic reticulum ATPase [Pirellulaceae bacterium]